MLGKMFFSHFQAPVDAQLPSRKAKFTLGDNVSENKRQLVDGKETPRRRRALWHGIPQIWLVRDEVVWRTPLLFFVQISTRIFIARVPRIVRFELSSQPRLHSSNFSSRRKQYDEKRSLDGDRQNCFKNSIHTEEKILETLSVRYEVYFRGMKAHSMELTLFLQVSVTFPKSSKISLSQYRSTEICANFIETLYDLIWIYYSYRKCHNLWHLGLYESHQFLLCCIVAYFWRLNIVLNNGTFISMNLPFCVCIIWSYFTENTI